MVADVRAVEQHVATFLEGNRTSKFDATLMVRLPSPDELGGIAAAVLLLVDGAMALVADEHQVLEVIQRLGWNALVSSRPVWAEGVDVRFLRDVDLLLGDGRLPERLVVTFELALPTVKGRTKPGVDLTDRESLFEIMEGRR